MAYIQERKNKEGKIISYSVRVSRGYDANGKQLKPYSATFRPDPQKSDRQNKKALDKFVIEFEEQCRSGIVLDSKQSFAEYCEYVIKLKERAGVKHKTIINYRKFMPLVTEHLGHLKLAEIRPQHLNNFYEILSRNGIRRKEGIAIAKCDIKEIFKKKSITIKKAAKKAGIASNTLSNVCNGGRIYESKARAISAFLGMPMNKLFKLEYDNTPFSNKTILEYHRFISAVLAQADKELLIPYNPARKATPPKAKRESVNYFQIEDVERIRDCLENEPIKWKTAVHLLLITGARRGEICGLKWRAVDWKNNRIHICNNLQYTPDLGIYEESTKTEESDRFVTLPPETMDILD